MSTITQTSDGDIGNHTVTQTEELQQRITQRLQFRRGTWALNPDAGTDTIIGHRITLPLAAKIIIDAIRDEGGNEIVDATITHIAINPTNRQLEYVAVVETIYDTPLQFSGSTL